MLISNLNLLFPLDYKTIINIILLNSINTKSIILRTLIHENCSVGRQSFHIFRLLFFELQQTIKLT